MVFIVITHDYKNYFRKKYHMIRNNKLKKHYIYYTDHILKAINIFYTK